MAAGCPVVTSDCYGTKELAEGAAILVNPESTESIASGIRQVLDDQSGRQALIEAGRERSATFRWSRCAQETLNVLERVQSTRKAVPRAPAAQGAAAPTR
jgi:glycosyltransferase involved in cell wall biosynthesis